MNRHVLLCGIAIGLCYEILKDPVLGREPLSADVLTLLLLAVVRFFTVVLGGSHVGLLELIDSNGFGGSGGDEFAAVGY